MRAVTYTRYGPPHVLRMGQAPRPTPKDDEVLIKVRATTVTVADTRSRSFTVPPVFWLPARLTLGLLGPRRTVLGAELAGDVVAVGKDVTRFKAGDPVSASTVGTFGGYAEYICLSEGGTIALKPSNLNYAEAAALPVGARTALHYLRKAGVQRGQKILIYGASGSVGSYAVQLARHFGAQVTAVCSTSNMQLVRSLGADRVIDYTREDFSAEGPLYDVIFEAVDKSAFASCAKALKRGGIYINITRPVPTLPMVWARLTAGVHLMLGENPPRGPEALIFIKELVEAGEIRPVIDRCYDLDQIVEAHAYVDKGHKRGNVAVRVAPERQARTADLRRAA